MNEFKVPRAVYRVEMTAHDYVFFATRAYGPNVDTEPYIHNFALMYALNALVVPVGATWARSVAGIKPHYEEDLQHFRIYATPAAPGYLHGNPPPTVGNTSFSRNSWPWKEKVKLSYNSIGSIYGFSMTLETRKVIPKFGSYMKYPPMNVFVFYVLLNSDLPLPRVIRIGKKYPPARLKYIPLEDIQIKNGEFSPDHPVNFHDLSPMHTTEECIIVSMPPCPLLINSRIRGPHIVGQIKGKKISILLPSPTVYPAFYRGGP